MSLRSLFGFGPLVMPPMEAGASLSDYQRDFSWDAVDRALTETVLTKADKERRKDAHNRHRLFCGGGLDLAEGVVKDMYSNEEVREWRIAAIKYARSHNLLKRFISEGARVYAKPPRSRTVTDRAENYAKVLELAQHDAAMRYADERLALNNDVFVLFRTRETPAGRAPWTDVIGPDDFTPIAHPHDPSLLVGVVIDQHPRVSLKDTEPHHLVWSPWESFRLNGKGGIMRETIEPNPFKIIPGVLISSAYRSMCLLDPVSGQDMVDAHLSVWFLRTLAIKESKSLNAQAAFFGETGRMPSGQAQDSSRDLTLPPGTGVTTIRRGMEVDQYLKLADHIEERCAAAYGIPPTVLRHAGATSGYEIDLRRIPLEELREDRIGIFRRAERAYAEVQATVLAHDMPRMAFGTDGWAMDFAEIKRPLSATTTYDLRRLKRGSGHSNPVDEAMEDNPDFSREMAEKFVTHNVEQWALFLAAIRALNIATDATATNPGQTPQQNGAMNEEREDVRADMRAEMADEMADTDTTA